MDLSIGIRKVNSMISSNNPVINLVINHQSYYRIDNENGCDIAVSDKNLVVNCSGVCVLKEPFTSFNKNGRQDYYLMYLIQGELEMDLPVGRQPMKAGQFILFSPGFAYKYTKHAQESDEIIYYWVHFTGYGVEQLLITCQIATNRLYDVGLHTSMMDNFHQTFRHFMTKDLFSDLATAAQVELLFVMIRRKLNVFSSPGTMPQIDKIQKSMHHIYMNYHKAVTVQELADIEHLSVSRFCALFRICAGESPQNFLINLRLQTSTELMLRTNLSIKQIANYIGYSDALYFSRLFKSRKGVSPKEYMAKLLESTR